MRVTDWATVALLWLLSAVTLIAIDAGWAKFFAGTLFWEGVCIVIVRCFYVYRGRLPR